MPRCPVCDADVRLDATPTAPFCSDRCRLIDLGRWLDEAYALPEKRRSDGDEDEGDEPDDGGT
ncbi:MAG: DNA gyrase inhibitor YacG [Planctomycetia bacterium]